MRGNFQNQERRMVKNSRALERESRPNPQEFLRGLRSVTTRAIRTFDKGK